MRLPDNTRYYAIGGITIQVESDLPITQSTFHEKFRSFRVSEPGADVVVIRHHFGLPDPIPGMDEPEHPREVYRKPPWAIYRTWRSWVYLGIAPTQGDPTLHRVAVFDLDHSSGDLYNSEAYEKAWLRGGLTSLTMFPSDQILLARLLADRQGCYLHSGALTVDGEGLVFVGHSEAGKSTTMDMVRSQLGMRCEILCDDRNIVRCWPEGFRVHGTWSHGDIPDVSSASASLRAILFLQQDRCNEIVPLLDRKEIMRRLLVTLIKPMVTAEWWTKEMDVLERVMAEVPCYVMRFDRTGEIVRHLEELAQ